MVVIDRRINKAYFISSKTKAAAIIGVDRSTIERWKKKRMADKTFREVYNYFEVYFDTERVHRNTATG